MFRTRFDPRIHTGLPMTAATAFTYDGKEYEAGDAFPVDEVHPRKVAQMYGARRIGFTNPEDAVPGRAQRLARREQLTAPEDTETGPATIEAQPGGYYLVNAPWFDEPERIRGKANAEARAAEINEAGEPETHHGYTLTEGENGWWKITRADDDAAEPVALNVQGEDKAREAIATLRRGELIEGTALPDEWAPAEPIKPGDVVLVGEPESDLSGLRATVESIDGDLAAIKGFKGEGDEATLVETTVPLASLTIAPPADPAEGGQDGADETPAEEGADTSPPTETSPTGEPAAEPGADSGGTPPADGDDQTNKEK